MSGREDNGADVSFKQDRACGHILNSDMRLEHGNSLSNCQTKYINGQLKDDEG